MKYLGTAVLALLGIIALSASASAAIVCNDDGDCWRVKEKYTYPPDVRLHVYEDDYVVDTKKYKWREPGTGRGHRNPCYGLAVDPLRRVFSEEPRLSLCGAFLLRNMLGCSRAPG